jgi:hypothetical protein
MAFTGKASYTADTQGNTTLQGIADDVADLIGMISPSETPLLDALGDAPYAAKSVMHEWLEDKLNPNTITSSTACASTTAATTVQVHDKGSSDQAAPYIQVGTVLKVNDTGEYLQVTGISNDYLAITRAFGGTSATSFGAGADITVISDVALEGADVSVDTSRPRVRKSNYTQIIKKDIIVSGTMQAVTQLGGVSNEFDYQKEKRTREIIRDLEKAAILGKTSGNSIGSSTAYRTMKGIWDFIATNSTSCATITPSALNDAMKGAYDAGASDLDLIVCDPLWKKVVDQFNESAIRVNDPSGPEMYSRQVRFFEGSFGAARVISSRWMPAKSLMVLSTQRVKVLPLQGRSFHYEAVAKTGDSEKGMVIGEYTVEVNQESGLAKVYG